MTLASTRRQFLIHGLGVSAALPLAFSRLSSGARRTHDWGESGGRRALVVVQLTGGNDGLNTLVPYRQDAYYRARPTLALAPEKLHDLDGEHGLHPSLGGLAELYARGELAVYHGVGPPLANRSHFRSLEIWHTADPDGPPGDSGWLGRQAERLAEREPLPLPALYVGTGELPLLMRGRTLQAPALADAAGLELAAEARAWSEARAALLEPRGSHAELAFLRDAARAAYAAAERMQALAARASPVDYPDHALARELALVARLIAGDFGASLFLVELGGFDTHARQGPLQAALLERLSGALAAFQADLAESGAAERVLVLVFSEFGRRAAENGSRGTDHGAGAPVFLAGGRVRGGLFGTAPDLERLADDHGGDVPATTDFRSLYAGLERDWLGLEPSLSAPPLELVR